MSFSSLSSRVLPVVIAGPILRRTELTGVTVWLALKKPASQIRLDIYDGVAVVATGLASTTALGNMLHIAVVRAIPLPAAILTAGKVYEYNVVFGSESGKDLNGTGILGGAGIAAISYAPRQRPSFVFPGSTAANLRFAHGSCRKPHGGEGDPNDALRVLDIILETTHDNPAERPQQLFLTGDQIYADDVADALLYMLQDAATSILGWTEPLPGNPGADQLKPGKRQKLVARTIFNPGLTSTHAKSHLITLGEFYCMYLFAWSDVLWSDLPEFETVFQPPPPKHEPNRGALTGWGSSPDPENPATFGLNETKEYSQFKKEVSSLSSFKSSLSAVRRALANIPVYMMFDDHEVTDDWFRTLEWSRDALTPDTLSRRIIQNGLSAFAVFQAWGNAPDKFALGTGLQVVSLLAQLNVDRGATSSRWAAVGGKLLPRLIEDGNEVFLLADIQWHFAIDFEAHTLIALDSRTHRGYASKSAAPSLINAHALPFQVPNRPVPKEVTVLLAPAPVLGHPVMEEFVQRVLEKIVGGNIADVEAWGFYRPTLEELLYRLVDYKRVVILSGDVHYGFSAAVDYWDDRVETAPRQARFVQVCSSALKNDVGLAYKLDPPSWLSLSSSWLGWASADAKPQALGPASAGAAGLRPGISRTPDNPVLSAGSGNCWKVAPKWRYTVEFFSDGRPPGARGIAIGTAPTNPRQRHAFYHGRAQTWDSHRTVVAQNNLGLVRIISTGAAVLELSVEQQLWYSPDKGSATTILPYTVHSVQLTPFTAAAKPGVECPR